MTSTQSRWGSSWARSSRSSPGFARRSRFVPPHRKSTFTTRVMRFKAFSSWRVVKPATFCRRIITWLSAASARTLASVSSILLGRISQRTSKEIWTLAHWRARVTAIIRSSLTFQILTRSATGTTISWSAASRFESWTKRVMFCCLAQLSWSEWNSSFPTTTTNSSSCRRTSSKKSSWSSLPRYHDGTRPNSWVIRWRETSKSRQIWNCTTCQLPR